MRMKDVIISVTGVQQSESGPDTVQLVTAGQYGVSADEIALTWQESELTGLEGTSTRLTVQPDLVVLSREGKLNTRMEFEEGKKRYFLYDTPYGSTTMGLNTYRIRKNLGLHGGEMEIDYVIDVDHTVIGRNRFFIQVQEPKKSHTGDIKWPT